MDYPQLNLFFGLSLMLVLAINMALRVLLSRQSLPVWMSIVSWTALVLSAISTLYIEILFLQRMTPAFHRQIGLGVLLIGGILAPITAFFIGGDYRPVPQVFFSVCRSSPA